MLWSLLLAAPAEAGPEATLHGSVKSFVVAGFPYETYGLSESSDALLELAGWTEDEALAAFGLSADPFGLGSADGRLVLEARWGSFRLDAHHALTVASTVTNLGLPGATTGTGMGAPEALPLTWTPDTGDGLSVQSRFDRLALEASVSKLELALGRQAVTFGSGVFFAPMDLVNPFHPATIDTEYKPGVDAFRVDAFAGVSSQLTVVAAWAGDGPLVGKDRVDPELDGAVFAASGRTTLGMTDLLAFGGLVHAEPVVGLGAVSAIGAMGVHGDATLTLPEDEDPFVRAVVGANWMPTGTTMVMAEAYVQTFGATEPDGYLEVAESERFARGEVWQLGRTYAALTVMQELTPLVSANVGAVANVEDPSALGMTGVTWSVADNATLTAGGYFGLGPRPDVLVLDLAIDPATFSPTLGMPSDEELAASVNSEFGLYPSTAYLSLAAWF